MERPVSVSHVVGDARAVFRYADTRPQERAHAYLERYCINREVSDTAMERVAVDLIDRAYRAGLEDAAATPEQIAGAVCSRLFAGLALAAGNVSISDEREPRR